MGRRASWAGAVRLDIDTTDIDMVVRSLGATPEQVRRAAVRALKRTATTIRLRSSKAAVSELQLRRASYFRRRIKSLRMRASKDGGEIGIWFGLNDIAVSEFKGRVTEYSGGAKFRQVEYPGAFVAKIGKKRSIFKRRGSGRFPVSEQTVPVKEQLDVLLEDTIFPDAIDVFMRNFMTDLRARTVFGIGKNG